MIENHTHEHSHPERKTGKVTLPAKTHSHSHPHLLGSEDPVNNHHELYRASGEDSEQVDEPVTREIPTGIPFDPCLLGD